MKVIVLIVICLLSIASTCFGDAEWADIPLEEIAKDSDLIAVAILTDYTEDRVEDKAYYAGELNIEQILKGDIRDFVEIKWVRSFPAKSVSTQYSGLKGIRLIWLLKKAGGDAYQADYPKRIQNIERLNEIVSMIGERALGLTIKPSKDFYEANEAMELRVSLKNITNKEIIFNRFYEPDDAGNQSGFRFNVYKGNLNTSQEYIHHEQVEDAVYPFRELKISPGEEKDFKVTLNKWYEMFKPATYRCTAYFRKDGIKSSPSNPATIKVEG